ncbi:MAG: hypothetical protein HYZ58_19380 [Acidobacteria bacterium]|nr:hypothetical protein [Acidobacteriota bacterium]
MKDPAAYGVYLWLLTVLLFARVLGQIIVVVYAPRWLPPMEQWQSGLLRYPVLLASQAVVLTLMVWISVDFSRGAGFWVEPLPRLGRAALWWSYLYFGAMVARYAIRMTRRSDQRWLGGTIPIIFHSVVAAFQWTFGTYHTTPR